LQKRKVGSLLPATQPIEKALLMLYHLNSVSQFLEESNFAAIQFHHELLKKQLHCL